MSGLYSALCKNIYQETPGTYRLVVQPPPEVQESYKTPGQYTTFIAKGLKPIFVAMAQPPQTSEWDFWIKPKADSESQFKSMKPGDSLVLSLAQGQGFSLDKAPGCHIHLFAVGTALAPIRSLLLSLLQNRAAYKNIYLYYGAKNPTQFGFAGEWMEWQSREVKIIPTISDTTLSGWDGLSGYVQNHLKLDSPIEENIAYICGMTGMMDAVTESLRDQGLKDNCIYRNY